MTAFIQLVLSVDNMNTKVSGRQSVNAAAEPGRDLLEIDVFDGRESVRAKNRCNASRFETADRTFIALIAQQAGQRLLSWRSLFPYGPGVGTRR